MKKEKIKNIVLIIVVAVISSTITSFAENNFLFNSVDVKYDNSNGVQAETVQGAIDELYTCASDYSEVNNKIDGYFKNNPTSYFDGNTLMLGKTNTVGNTALQFFNDGIMNGHIYTRKSDHAMVVTSDNNKPLLLSGRPINLASDQVQIGGTNINDINTKITKTILYDGNTNGNITFNEDVSTYKYIVITYVSRANSAYNYGLRTSVVPTDYINNGVELGAYAFTTQGNMFFNIAVYALLERGLQLSSFTRWPDWYHNGNQIFIIRVEGIR